MMVILGLEERDRARDEARHWGGGNTRGFSTPQKRVQLSNAVLNYYPRRSVVLRRATQQNHWRH